MKKYKLIKWIGNKYVDDNHRHDYRWLPKEQQEEWILKHWKVKGLEQKITGEEK